MADPAPAFHALTPEEQQRMLDGPGLEPPANIIPNFSHPPNNNAAAHGEFAVSVVLTSIFILFAVYIKATQYKGFYLEDACALVAVAGWIILMVLVYHALVKYGFFIHQWDLALRDVPGWFYLIYIATIAYFIVMATIKPAILMQWVRLFVPLGSRTTFFWTCHVTAWTNFIASITQLFLVAFACTPRAKYWDPFVLGTCLDANATAFAAPIINLAFDLIILILPQKVIWNLHLPWKKKLGIATLFALGLLACVSAALRIAYSFTFYSNPDRTFTNAPVALLCVAEATVGLLVYCVPAAPKALAGLKRGAKKSTTALLSGPSKNSQGSGSWSGRKVAPNLREGGGYKELDEVPLTNLGTTSASASGLTGHYDDNGAKHNGDGIMRTTTTTVSYKDGVRRPPVPQAV